MNNNKSICALNADKNNCLPNTVIQSLSEVVLSDPKNIIIPKISKALNCDTNLSLPDQELCILNKIKNKTDDENLKQAIDKQVLKTSKIPKITILILKLIIFNFNFKVIVPDIIILQFI